jgi:hypothetical protein
MADDGIELRAPDFQAGSLCKLDPPLLASIALIATFQYQCRKRNGGDENGIKRKVWNLLYVLPNKNIKSAEALSLENH